MNNETMTFLFKLILSIMSVLITGYILPWIRSKMCVEQYNELITFIGACVGAAEKLYTPDEWKDKKEYVLKLAEHKLSTLNITITAEELNGLIEGMVYSVKEK